MELYISIIGAIVAIGVAILGAILANKNNIELQLRKLVEDHYTSYIDALQALASYNGKQEIKDYTTARNKLLLIASDDVVISLLEFEKYGVGKSSEEHDKYLTFLYKAMRKDLNIKSKHLPTLYLRKPNLKNTVFLSSLSDVVEHSGLEPLTSTLPVSRSSQMS